MRQPSGHWSDKRNAVPAKIPHGACRDRSGYYHQRARHAGSKTAKQKKNHHRDAGRGHTRQMDVRQLSQHLTQLQKTSTRRNRYSEHLAQHCDTDLKANSGKKAGKHGLG